MDNTKICKYCGKKYFPMDHKVISKITTKRWKESNYCSFYCSLISIGKKNKGIVHSEKSKKNMSEGHQQGKVPWNKGLHFPQFTGKNNNNWKGGITPENTKIRNSMEYLEWRKLVFKKDDYTCQKCYQISGILNAHHIESFNNNPNLRTKIKNGVTLCKNCHKNFHHMFGNQNNKNQLLEFLKKL
jgi:hypothetical protein